MLQEIHSRPHIINKRSVSAIMLVVFITHVDFSFTSVKRDVKCSEKYSNEGLLITFQIYVKPDQ